jgi:toxin-antitoxin system PIN domain toxin
MIALLDVNVLVALFDPTHVHHEAAHEWFAPARKQGWATCPITELGLIRVLSNPGYSGRRTTALDARHRLAQFASSGGHLFWSDTVSLRDDDVFDLASMMGHRQLTDLYLLGTAVANRGALATFDRGIARACVKSATTEHVIVIGA